MRKPRHQSQIEKDAVMSSPLSRQERHLSCSLLRQKYESYLAQRHGVFAVTLATFVSSKRFAIANFPKFWNDEFIGRLKQRIPFALRDAVDHDFFLEQSPNGHWHFHGFLAVGAAAAPKLWRDGKLTPAVENDLRWFAKEGSDRGFSINSSLIEPIREGDDGLSRWIQYSSKDPLHISSIDYRSELAASNRDRASIADAESLKKRSARHNKSRTK